ncbi:MAG: hypothetical protein N2314_08935 [Brevinematales bacterium]|nr:hypothetical protein [Brevinematales bacterium]
MKRILHLLIGIGLFQYLWAQNTLEPLVARGELVFYVPSHTYLVEGLRFFYTHFYGANFKQKWAELSSQSLASYGVDILDAKSIASIGIHTNSPLVFVHVSENKGYLALPVANKKTLEAYLKKNLAQTASRFVSHYLLLSQSEEVFSSLSNQLITSQDFLLSVSKLPDVWKNGWIWFESRYLSSITRGTGVSDKVNLPTGFGLISVVFEPKILSFRAYTAAIDPKQQEFLYQLQQFDNTPRFHTLDYVRGNPLLVAKLSLNLSLLYRYYRAVDRIDIMGIAGLLASLKKDYGVDMERDFIHNSEGRCSLVIDRFSNAQPLYYGSVGIKNRTLALHLMESLKNMVVQKQEPLYAFEIFTLPFYHYKMSNGSLYFGMVENEFFFASDKELLVQCIKDIYEKKSGISLPAFFTNPRQKTGIQAKIDIQTLLSTLSQDNGIRLAREFFIGMESMEIESYPDTTMPAYGWTTEVRVKFYK